MMKSLTRTEKTVAIIFWMLVIQSGRVCCGALCLEMAIRDGVAWVAVIGFCGTFSHYCMRARCCMRRHRGVADGLPSRSADPPLSAGCFIRSGWTCLPCSARRDPRRQSAEFEPRT